MCGGLLGAAAREAIEQALPTPAAGFPFATFMINLAGAFLLGLLLEALVRSDRDEEWRHHARLAGGTGFCGAFTTYSTLAVETVQLARHGAGVTAASYLAASVVAGVAAAALGILAGAARSRRSGAIGPDSPMPVDPDVDTVGRPG